LERVGVVHHAVGYCPGVGYFKIFHVINVSKEWFVICVALWLFRCWNKL
jgi:hypothetical protein